MKKNDAVTRGLVDSTNPIVLKIMKISFFLLLVCTFSVNAAGYSQTRISIAAKDASVRNVIREIETKSDFTFFYNEDFIDLNQKVTYSAENESVINVLANVANQTGLNFKMMENNLVVVTLAGKNQQTITGKVTNENGEPLPGVTVVVKGTTNGTVTDVDGKYTLTIADDAKVLVFTYIGMNPEEVTIGNQTIINVVLKIAAVGLNEVMVVGYGTQRKASLTGSVATVKGNNLTQSSSVNVSNSLAGRLSGVVANNRSGRPGEDNSQILIRGLNTFGGGNSPLIVVDGIPDRDMNRLNPADIETVTVLKDASAAIYGVRSANGVILVTTKRGKSGKPVVTYDGSFGTQQLTRLDKRVGAWEYMTYYNELNVDKGGTAPYSQSDIDKYKAGNDPNYTTTDWLGEVYRKNAPQTSHSLSVNGGNDQVKYYFSGQFLNQTSNFSNSSEDFKEFNIMSNIDVKVTKNLGVYLDIAARKEDRWHPVWDISDILHETVSMYPFLPVYWSNGLPDACISNGRNPVILTSAEPGYDKINRLIVNPKMGFTLQMPYIVEGLSLSGYAAFDFNIQSEKKMQKPWDAYTYDKTTDTYINQRSSTSITSITQDEKLANQNTYFLKLNFERQFAKHGINAFVGYEQTTNNSHETYAYRRDLLSDQVDQIFTGSTEGQTATGAALQDGRASYLGRVAYNYSEKYMADIAIRYNGSFNFPADNRWGLFPAISLGWRVSEENFFKSNIKAIQNLKIRASWGIMGNDAIAQYLYITRYQMIITPEQYTYF